MSLIGSKVWAARGPKSPGIRVIGGVVAAAPWNPGQVIRGLWEPRVSV
jgi:hypothetical protein